MPTSLGLPAHKIPGRAQAPLQTWCKTHFIIAPAHAAMLHVAHVLPTGAAGCVRPGPCHTPDTHRVECVAQRTGSSTPAVPALPQAGATEAGGIQVRLLLLLWDAHVGVCMVGLGWCEVDSGYGVCVAEGTICSTANAHVPERHEDSGAHRVCMLGISNGCSVSHCCSWSYGSVE